MSRARDCSPFDAFGKLVNKQTAVWMTKISPLFYRTFNGGLTCSCHSVPQADMTLTLIFFIETNKEEQENVTTDHILSLDNFLKYYLWYESHTQQTHHKFCKAPKYTFSLTLSPKKSMKLTVFFLKQSKESCVSLRKKLVYSFS